MTRPAAARPPGAVLDDQSVMVEARAVSRTFGHGSTAVHAVRGVSFDVQRGQLVALVGRSGSGKTTLLNIIGGLDSPTSGEVFVGGRNLSAMTARERTMLRRSTVSFIFQSFGLIPMLTAAENVGIPLRIIGTPTGCAGGADPAACSASSAWTATPTSARTSCRAGSSSASPSPGHWPCSRSC